MISFGMVRICGLLLLCSFASGCSLLFTQPPPPPAERSEEPDCSTTFTAPVLDLLLFAGVSALAEGEPDYRDRVVQVGWLSLAGFGFVNVIRCRTAYDGIAPSGGDDHLDTGRSGLELERPPRSWPKWEPPTIQDPSQKSDSAF